MRYEHTQNAPLHYLLYGVAGILFAMAWVTRHEPVVSGVLIGAGMVVGLFSLCFVSLTIADEGERLAIRFGPLPLFGKSIRYADITDVEPGRSSLLDGWGIHYVPGRGWTYNLWGYDCAVLHLGKKVIRVGSDDVGNLVEFLRGKVSVSS